jgi:hypothetical protein
MWRAGGWGIVSILMLALVGTASKPTDFPTFKMQQIEGGLKVGYAVHLEDLNGDGKRDIIVVDTTRVVWYENPTWQRRTIIEGQTRPDNVCITALDIDRDGQLDLVLGADWKPFNTAGGGTLHWLKRGKLLDEPWTLHPIGEEPTVHRVRVADVDGDGQPEIVLAPLMGRGSSKANNWTDGRPVRLLAYPIPADPVKGPWTPKVLDESLHVMHNFWPIAATAHKGHDLLTASYEGVHLVQALAGKFTTTKLGAGNQSQPLSNRGASEIKRGQLAGQRPFIATIEPWHGNQVVVYTPPTEPTSLWDRHVIDTELTWGHAVWCADLDGDGSDELIIGVRDNPNPKAGDQHKLQRGVRLYRALDGVGKQWVRHLLDEGGVAVEDLAATDLNGDGKVDLVAVGRATGNARIYWNQGR